MIKENVCEVEFEQLNKNNIEKLDSKEQILKSNIDISVEIGSCNKNINDILNLKNGDLMILNKIADEELDIKANNLKIGQGETLILDNKIGIRLSKID